MGLRTLALGYKTITNEQFESFEELLNSAAHSIVNRAKYEREVYQQMEKGNLFYSLHFNNIATLKTCVYTTARQ